MDDCCNLSCTGYIEPVQQTNNLIFDDANGNTTILSLNETYFSNNNHAIFTKIDINGRLLVYHNSAVNPTGCNPGWWDVEGTFVNMLSNIRNDVNNNTLITSENNTIISALNEIHFTNNDSLLVKIDVNGNLFVYHNSDSIPPGYPQGFWNVEQKLTETITNDIGLRVDLTATQLTISEIQTTLTNLTSVDLPATVAGLEAQIALRENILTFNNPLNKSSSVVTLNYDNSLTLVNNNLSVVKTASNPISISGNNFLLNYDSSLTLVGNNLSVVKTASYPISISGNNFLLN